MKSATEQLDLLTAGCETVITREELLKKLQTGKPLRVKLGCDPTAPDLHLGHSVVLRKLRQFQDLGHKAVLIIGDYTALVGDPTGQNKTRPMLNADDIERNAKTYFDQAGKILDTSPDKLEIHRNSEWLAKMNLADTLRLASQMTVARMLERDTFEQRFEADVPIGIHEFLYPLMQGHDSVMIRADVELGGSDQLFNNLVGRDLQRDAGQEPQCVMILPILEGLDGVEKMSKSKGNYIGLNDPPMTVLTPEGKEIKGMYGKGMSISDELMWRWYRLLFGKTDAEIAALQQMHPMQAKKALARALVEQYHGAIRAEEAERDFVAQFSARDLANAAKRVQVDGSKRLIDVLYETGRFSSKSEIRNLIRDGRIKVNGRSISDPTTTIRDLGDNILVASGHKFAYRIESLPLN